MMDELYEITSIGGNCPVQAEGLIMGFSFYFRARGSIWSFTVYDGSREGWNHFEEYRPDEDFAAGWMTEDEARAFIGNAARMFKDQRASASSETAVRDAALEEAAWASLKETDCEGECERSYPETCAHRRLRDLLEQRKSTAKEPATCGNTNTPDGLPCTLPVGHSAVRNMFGHVHKSAKEPAAR